jgi:diaminohydroxyphosphoribosylaminopyrimidine deaminase / 5-amino-6-(5-phosphoribosylamino)uracil reductase
VVVAALDPSAKVDGKGAAALRAAGVAVDVADGDIAVAARRQNAPFRTLSLLGRPHVTYKAAISLDGRTATAAGESRWISSAESRHLVHELRARAGAVAVGVGTAIRDDPQLTARDVEPRAERQPVRVVFDRRGRLPLESVLVQTARDVPVIAIAEPAAAGREALERAGVDVLEASPADALQELGRRGISSMLLEGGAELAGALLAAGLVDRVALFAAPILIGEGRGLLDGLAIGALADAPRLHGLRARPVGPDILLEAELREV